MQNLLLVKSYRPKLSTPSRWQKSTSPMSKLARAPLLSATRFRSWVAGTLVNSSLSRATCAINDATNVPTQSCRIEHVHLPVARCRRRQGREKRLGRPTEHDVVGRGTVPLAVSGLESPLDGGNQVDPVTGTAPLFLQHGVQRLDYLVHRPFVRAFIPRPWWPKKRGRVKDVLRHTGGSV